MAFAFAVILVFWLSSFAEGGGSAVAVAVALALAFLVVIPARDLLSLCSTLGSYDELLRYDYVSAGAGERSVKKRTKIILAVPIILISYLGINYYLWQQRVAAKERKTYDEQLASYAAFLKPGMTRADVERELRQRSIRFESYNVDGTSTDDFVLLERFESPHLYCSFEDAMVRFEFDPGSSLLRKTSVYRQLKDCL